MIDAASLILASPEHGHEAAWRARPGSAKQWRKIAIGARVMRLARACSTPRENVNGGNHPSHDRYERNPAPCRGGRTQGGPLRHHVPWLSGILVLVASPTPRIR